MTVRLRPGARLGVETNSVKLAIGLELKFALRVELGGAARPSSDLLAKINEILRGIRRDLELR